MLSLISDFGTDNDAHAGGSIQFTTQSHNGSNQSHVQPYAGIYGGHTNSYTNYKGELIFYTSDINVDTSFDSTTGIGKNLNPVMTITGDKRVGIGVTSPDYPLHVGPNTVEPTTTNSIFAYYDGNTDYYFGEHQSGYDFIMNSTTPNHRVSAKFDNNIWVGGDFVILSSDSRIKKYNRRS